MGALASLNAQKPRQTVNSPIESQATYTYSPTDGRLASASDSTNTFTYSYLANSNLLETITGPAHTVTNIWETGRNALSQKQNKVGSTNISSYNYTVNAIGQRSNVAQSGSAFAGSNSIAWGYDSLGQVTSADSTIPGFDRAYQYDQIGNRLKTAYPLPVNLSADSSLIWDAEQCDRKGSILDGGIAVAHRVKNARLRILNQNRLISAIVTSGDTVNYVYDAQSRRIVETTNGSNVTFVYDGWNPIAEYTGGTLSKSYIWGVDLSGSMQGAGGVGGLLSVNLVSGGLASSFFPTYDGNGNVSEYLNSIGTPVAHYEYDPFGRTTVATGPQVTDFTHRFSTKPLDFAIGLYYYGYRWYDPATGRWPSRDPIGDVGGPTWSITFDDFTSRLDYLNYVEIISQKILYETESDNFLHEFRSKIEDIKKHLLEVLFEPSEILSYSNIYMFNGNNSILFIDLLGLDYFQYSQSSGNMTRHNDNGQKTADIGKGYSGKKGESRNNPNSQGKKNEGPIPRGKYEIQKPRNSKKTGPHVMDLKPDPTNDMEGRDSFQIHGDNSRGDASTGCIILGRSQREAISKSGVNELRVVK